MSVKCLACPRRPATGYDLHDSVLRACCPYKLFLSARGGAAGKQDNPMPCHLSFVLQSPFLQRPRVLESLKLTVVEYDWQGSLL